MYTIYSFTQIERDLTIIVLLNGKGYEEDGLQDILIDQNPFEKIKERFGKDNISMMVSVNDRDLDDGRRHCFKKIEDIVFLKDELNIETLDNKETTIIRVNHKQRCPLDYDHTFASTTPSDSHESFETIYSIKDDWGFNQSTSDIPIPSKSFSKPLEDSTPNTQKIEIIQAPPFYEKDSLGRFFEIEILDIALSLKQRGLLECFLKTLPGKMELMISDPDITSHFFVKCTFNTEQNPKCYQYNSQYDASNYTNLKLTNVPEQFITKPIQGYTSCGYFSQFFIVNAVEYVNLKLKDLKSEDLVKHFKSSQFNLKIVQDVLNYFNPKQTVFRIKTKLVENDPDHNNYLIFSGENEQNQTQYYCFTKQKSDLGPLQTFGDKVNLYSIIDYKNILEYYCSQTFGLVFKGKQKSSIESTVQTFENIKRPKSPKGRLNTRTSQQETQLSIPSSISNGKQSLPSQNQIELAKDKTECRESNFIQSEQQSAMTNASKPDTSYNKTQSVQNTDSSFNKEQTSTPHKPEFLSPTMKLSLQKLGSLKNETKQSRPYEPSDQSRLIKINIEYGLASKAPRHLQGAKYTSKTANSRAKSVINYPSAVHNLARSPQQNQRLASLINARRIHKPQAQFNQTNNLHLLLQPLEPIVKPIIVSENTISQVKARIASLERDRQYTQQSNSSFKSHQK